MGAGRQVRATLLHRNAALATATALMALEHACPTPHRPCSNRRPLQADGHCGSALARQGDSGRQACSSGAGPEAGGAAAAGQPAAGRACCRRHVVSLPRLYRTVVENI